MHVIKTRVRTKEIKTERPKCRSRRERVDDNAKGGTTPTLVLPSSPSDLDPSLRREKKVTGQSMSSRSVLLRARGRDREVLTPCIREPLDDDPLSPSAANTEPWRWLVHILMLSSKTSTHCNPSGQNKTHFQTPRASRESMSLIRQTTSTDDSSDVASPHPRSVPAGLR